MTLPPDPWTAAGGPFFASLLPATRAEWLDALLNVALFVPLGIVIASRGLPNVILLCALLSTAIEMWQLLVPGRDARARDILANTLGASLGPLLISSPIWRERVHRMLDALDRRATRLHELPVPTADRFAFVWALLACVLLILPGFLVKAAPPFPPYLVPGPQMDVSSGPLRIGSQGFDDGFFSGLIDEVRIFARARPGSAIRSDMLRPVSTSAQLEPDLVAAYGFDAGKGTTARDDSGHGHDGVIRNALWTDYGRFGGALSFDGRSSEVLVDASDALNLRDEMTLEAWMLAKGEPGSESTIIARDRTYFLRASSEGRRFEAAGGTRFGGRYEDARLVAGISPGKWTHVAVSYDGQTIQLYVDGVLVATNLWWSPHRATRVWLNGIDLRPGLVMDAMRVRESLLNVIELRATIRCGRPTSLGNRVFFTVGPGAVDALSIRAVGADILVSGATRASRLNLPSPEFRLRGALSACSPGEELDLALKGPLPDLRAMLNGQPAHGVVPGPGSGWAFLFHSEMLPYWIARTCKLVWIAFLLFPFGFWAQPRLLTGLGAAALVIALANPSPPGNIRAIDASEAAAAVAGLLIAAAYRRATHGSVAYVPRRSTTV